MVTKGRKTKLTQQLIQQAAKLISEGNHDCTVVNYLGIDKSTWYKWMQEGETAESGLKKDFFDTIKKAAAKSEVTAVKGILKAGKKQWQALAWYLERKFGERWALKQDTTQNDGSINALVEALKKSKNDNDKVQ